MSRHKCSLGSIDCIKKERLTCMVNNNTVIALVNRKGGTSKTTSAAYMAAVLESFGRQVVGIDLDPDSSWLKLKAAGGIKYDVLKGEKGNVKEQIKNFQSFVVIDTPPNDGEIIYEVSAVADEVIAPLAPSVLDVGRLVTTLKTVANVEEMRGKPLTSVLLVKWRSNFNITKEVEQGLKEKNIPLLKSTIKDLVRYRQDDAPTYLDEYEAVLKELELI